MGRERVRSVYVPRVTGKGTLKSHKLKVKTLLVSSH